MAKDKPVTNVLVLDTETTGMDHEKDKVVEVGAVLLKKKGKKHAIAGDYSCLVDPGFPMPPYARAIHHISDEDLAGAFGFEEAIERLKAFAGLERFYIAAQNAQFDAGFFPKKSDWICTWRCGQHLWPDLESHSNQAMRYAVPGVNEAIEKAGAEKALPPHRALPDAWVTAHIVLKMLETKTPEELIELTKAPILLKKVRFGKHRGLLWSEVPKDYLAWVVRQQDMDSDVKHTASSLLRKI